MFRSRRSFIQPGQGEHILVMINIYAATARKETFHEAH